jgi:DNA-binding XRE family transcriptional regulator
MYKIPITIHLSNETIQTIESLVNYKNVKDDLNFPTKQQHFTVEDFITGCVNLYIKQLQTWEEISGLDDLGKPYRLKNRFKEIAEKKGIKGKDLAKLTGIHEGNISIALSNRSQPSIDYFLRIWIALGRPDLQDCLYREKEDE